MLCPSVSIRMKMAGFSTLYIRVSYQEPPTENAGKCRRGMGRRFGGPEIHSNMKEKEKSYGS